MLYSLTDVFNNLIAAYHSGIPFEFFIVRVLWKLANM